MNVGDVLSDSVRRSVGAGLARRARGLDVDVEQDLGVVADEADGHDEEARAPPAARAVMSSLRSGPIHGSGVRPALW